MYKRRNQESILRICTAGTGAPGTLCTYCPAEGFYDDGLDCSILSSHHNFSLRLNSPSFCRDASMTIDPFIADAAESFSRQRRPIPQRGFGSRIDRGNRMSPLLGNTVERGPLRIIQLRYCRNGFRHCGREVRTICRCQDFADGFHDFNHFKAYAGYFFRGNSLF